WVREGRAETLLGAVRAEARARRALAARILPAAAGPAESLHVWLPLQPDVSPERLRRGGPQRGPGPGAPAPLRGRPAPPGGPRRPAAVVGRPRPAPGAGKRAQ